MTLCKSLRYVLGMLVALFGLLQTVYGCFDDENVDVHQIDVELVRKAVTSGDLLKVEPSSFTIISYYNYIPKHSYRITSESDDRFWSYVLSNAAKGKDSQGKKCLCINKTMFYKSGYFQSDDFETSIINSFDRFVESPSISDAIQIAILMKFISDKSDFVLPQKVKEAHEMAVDQSDIYRKLLNSYAPRLVSSVQPKVES